MHISPAYFTVGLTSKSTGRVTYLCKCIQFQIYNLALHVVFLGSCLGCPGMDGFSWLPTLKHFSSCEKNRKPLSAKALFVSTLHSPRFCHCQVYWIFFMPWASQGFLTKLLNHTKLCHLHQILVTFSNFLKSNVLVVNLPSLLEHLSSRQVIKKRYAFQPFSLVSSLVAFPRIFPCTCEF